MKNTILLMPNNSDELVGSFHSLVCTVHYKIVEGQIIILLGLIQKLVENENEMKSQQSESITDQTQRSFLDSLE